MNIQRWTLQAKDNSNKSEIYLNRELIQKFKAKLTLTDFLLQQVVCCDSK
jgi:hypothetical protein